MSPGTGPPVRSPKSPLMTHGGSYQHTIITSESIVHYPGGSCFPLPPARTPQYTLDRPSHGRPHLGPPITSCGSLAMTLRFLYAPRSRPRFLSTRPCLCVRGSSPLASSTNRRQPETKRPRTHIASALRFHRHRRRLVELNFFFSSFSSNRGRNSRRSGPESGPRSRDTDRL